MNGSKGGTRSRFVGPLAVIVALLGLIFLAACDPALSIHTLYTDQDVVFEPSLVGTWVSSDETDEDLEIEKADKDSYLIKLLSKDAADNVNLEAHLVKIGGCLFLDAVQQNVAKGDASRSPDTSSRASGSVQTRSVLRTWMTMASQRMIQSGPPVFRILAWCSPVPRRSFSSSLLRMRKIVPSSRTIATKCIVRTSRRYGAIERWPFAA